MRTVVLERIERRVLGALRFVDATSGIQVQDPLTVSAEHGSLMRNRSNQYVITHVDGLETHETAFLQPPAAPALRSVTFGIAVEDASGQYLARRANVTLPRDSDPTHSESIDSLFRPVDILLYPAPTAAVSPNWSLLRVSVVRSGTAEGLAGALLRVIRTSDSVVLGRGLSDARGEALVAISGIPVTTWETGPGAVLATETAATIEAVFDPLGEAIPDPDDLEARRAALPSTSSAVMLAAGRTLVLSLSIVIA